MKVKATTLATLIGIYTVLAPFKLTTDLKNPLKENIVMCAPPIKENITAENVLTLQKEFFLKGDASGKHPLQTAIDKMSDQEYKKLHTKRTNDDVIAPIRAAYIRKYKNTSDVNKFFNAIIEVHKAIKDGNLTDVRKKHGEDFVSTILITAYFKQGRFNEFFSAVEKSKDYAPVKLLYNNFAELLRSNDQSRYQQLVFWELTNLDPSNAELDEKTKQAIAVMNSYFKLSGNDLTLQTINALGEKHGIAESRGEKVDVKDAIIQRVELPLTLTPEEQQRYSGYLQTWVESLTKKPDRKTELVAKPYYWKFKTEELNAKRGLVALVQAELNKKTPVSDDWLNAQLKAGKFDSFLEQVVLFKAEDAAKTILNSSSFRVENKTLGAAEASVMLIGERFLGLGSLDMKLPVNKERMKTAQLLLAGFAKKYSSDGITVDENATTLGNLLTDAKIIPSGNEYVVNDANFQTAVSVVQKFLVGRTLLETGFGPALQSIGIGTLPTNGQLDASTLSAIGVYCAVKNNANADVIASFGQVTSFRKYGELPL